jgi:hypothetical protein
VQRSIATTALCFFKRLVAGSTSVWVFAGMFTVLVFATELFAQDQKATPLNEVEKTSKDAGASNANAVNLADAAVYAEPNDQPEYEDPPRELITQDESDAFKKRGDREFKSALRLTSRRTTATDMKIKEGIRVWVHRMSLKENQRKVRIRMGDLLRQIRNSGGGEKRAQPKKEFRRFICRETVARAKELLDNNNELRLNATILISELNVMEPGSKSNPPAEVFSPATAVLLEIMQDPKQPVPVKIQAARGITRNALLGLPLLRTAHKKDLVNAIVKELENARKLPPDQAGPWYQARLLEALAAIDLPLMNVNDDPLIFETLESFLDDSKLDFSVRCMAARSIGRAHLVNHPDIDPERLSLKLAELGLELTNGFNKNMQINPAAFPRWQKYFWDLYVAFRPENDYDRVLYRNRKLGLRAIYPNRKDIEDAYRKILPLTAHVLRQPVERNKRKFIDPLPATQIQALSDWIKNHPQASNSQSVPTSTTFSDDDSR